MKTIIQCCNLGQHSIYQEITEIVHNTPEFRGVKKVRIEIDVDESYRHQSSNSVQVWSGEKWEFIESIPWAMMKSKPNGYQTKGVIRTDGFQQDRNELVRIATEVLFE